MSKVVFEACQADNQTIYEPSSECRIALSNTEVREGEKGARGTLGASPDCLKHCLERNLTDGPMHIKSRPILSGVVSSGSMHSLSLGFKHSVSNLRLDLAAFGD